MRLLRLSFFFFSFLFFLLTPSFAESKVILNPSSFEIGKIEEGRLYQYNINIKNTGDTDLIVSTPYVSCGCLKIISPKQKIIIPARDEAELKFSFDSTGYKGEVINFIYFNSNDPNQRTVSIQVKADVMAKHDSFIERFNKFGPLTIISASLLDSINPCAFTVIVFFISFLSFAGYNKKAMATVGSAFILAVFISYILIGMGIFQFLKQLEIFQALAKAVYLITAFLALTLGLYSLYDAWIYHKTKDADKVILKLPNIIKARIQAVIRKKTDIRADSQGRLRHHWALLISALSCGFIVSVLEFVCTGQLYLPTIVYILGVPALRLKAIFYLLLYNFIFILPLIFILYLGIVGITHKEFSGFLRRHLVLVKFATALLFLVLGSSLLIFIRK